MQRDSGKEGKEQINFLWNLFAITYLFSDTFCIIRSTVYADAHLYDKGFFFSFFVTFTFECSAGVIGSDNQKVITFSM